MTDEAKQAAEGTDTTQVHIEHYFPKGYDPDAEPWKSIRVHHYAATAKLREENEPLKRCLKQMQDAAMELAHQQPSAPTPESLMTPEQAKAWSEHCGKAFDTMIEVQQKPTPDVEQHWRIVDYGDSIGMVLQEGDNELAVLDSKLTYAKAVKLRDRHNQARAPLVEAVEHATECALKGERPNLVLLRQALTGTEEK